MSSFRAIMEDSDSEDSKLSADSDRQGNRRLVIDDPSDDDSSGFTTAREEDDDDELNVPLANLRLSVNSPAVNNDAFQSDSPSTTSMVEKLKAGGIPHVVVGTNHRDSGVSSLEHHQSPYSDDDMSRYTETPSSKNHLDGNKEADDKSTVVQEGRTKTPKRPHSPVIEDHSSEALLDSNPENNDSTASHISKEESTPAYKSTLDYNSEALLDSSPDDTSTVVQEGRTKTPKKHPAEDNNSEALLDSSIEEDDTESVYPAETPTRVSSCGNNSDALLDSSPESAASTVVQVKTPKRWKTSLSDTSGRSDHNSEALVEAISIEQDDGTTSLRVDETPKREPSVMSNTSDALVLDDTPSTTASQPAVGSIPMREPSLCNSEALLDSSMEQDDVSVAMRAARTSEAFTVDELSSDDNDDTSTLYPAESPSRDASVTSETLVDLVTEQFDSLNVNQESEMSAEEELQIPTPVPERLTNVETLLVDTSSEEEDSIVVDTTSPIKAENYKSLCFGEDNLVDTSSEEQDDDTSTVVQEGRVKTPKRPLIVDDDSSDDSLSGISTTGDTERKVASFEDAYDDCAWELDTSTNEVFLSDDKCEAPSGMLWPNLRLPRELFDRLYCHQKVGVQWMAGLDSVEIGGVLGDDMGMGKTFQTLALLGGLMRGKTIKNALVVAPVSVLASWEKEARVVIKRSSLPNSTIVVVSSDMKKPRRQRLLQDALSCSVRSPYLVITTYGLVSSSTPDFLSSSSRDYFDYIVLDEGHSIKNPSAKCSKACETICQNPNTRRLVLTGTLIQNNLKELWAVVNWATSGKVFGPLAKFKIDYATPIEEGRHKNATSPTIKRAELANNELKDKLRPYYLQRMKKDFLQDELPPKHELVVWTHLSEKQREMYESYIKDEEVADILSGETKSPLTAISWLKKLCGHPILVETTGEYNRELHVESRSKQDLLRDSAKLQVLVSLLHRLRNSGHRTLIFSQSTRTLDIIESILVDFSLSRIDGDTKGKERQELVESFNGETSRFDAMLISTKAGGLGLTLTGADRAIIYDPSWNPAADAQAIDRCYRIGQRKEVIVYRFIASGTVEEKMLAKQVHKDGIRRAVTTRAGNDTERYFEKKDLRKLFELGEAGTCEMLSKFGETTNPHSSFLKSMSTVVGVSSHDDIYRSAQTKAFDDGDAPTPFGGASASAKKAPPAFLGRSQRALAKSKRKIDFSAKENQADNVARTSSISVVDAAVPVGSTSIDAIDVDAEGSAGGDGASEAEIEALLNTVDRMRAQGNDVAAVSILMDILKHQGLEGRQKLRVHKGLAEVGHALSWLS